MWQKKDDNKGPSLLRVPLIRWVCSSPLHCFGLAAFVRILFLLYGTWQDATMVVKYTDIDYFVFSDAAKFVEGGGSPYLRTTYRYTPLLAEILTLNEKIHPSFGKVLFAVCDLFVGLCQLSILRSGTCGAMSRAEALLITCSWLFNPFVVNVSTRGNAEALVSLIVVVFLYFISKNKVIPAAISFGLAVHFKIYPIIYTPAALLYLGRKHLKRETKRFAFYPSLSSLPSPSSMFAAALSASSLVFSLVSAATFFILGFYYYHKYGQEFLDHSYLYHISRQDHRHNFSVYFYLLYLAQGIESAVAAKFVAFAAFLPQLLLVSVIAARYAGDIFFASFLQTLVFVGFNKVQTVQYSCWFFCLIPFALAGLRGGGGGGSGASGGGGSMWKGAVICALLWFGTQGFWLSAAYRLEFLGENTFFTVWIGGILFFLSNLVIICVFCKNYHKTSLSLDAAATAVPDSSP